MVREGHRDVCMGTHTYVHTVMCIRTYVHMSGSNISCALLCSVGELMWFLTHLLGCWQYHCSKYPLRH